MITRERRNNTVLYNIHKVWGLAIVVIYDDNPLNLVEKDATNSYEIIIGLSTIAMRIGHVGQSPTPSYLFAPLGLSTKQKVANFTKIFQNC